MCVYNVEGVYLCIYCRWCICVYILSRVFMCVYTDEGVYVCICCRGCVCVYTVKGMCMCIILSRVCMCVYTVQDLYVCKYFRGFVCIYCRGCVYIFQLPCFLLIKKQIKQKQVYYYYYYYYLPTPRQQSVPIILYDITISATSCHYCVIYRLQDNN